MSRLYQVQAIRAHKEVDGKMQYLVHWKRYSDDYDTWEPVDNLKGCDKIIEEYQMKVKRQSTPRRQTRTPARTPRRSSRIAKLTAVSKEDSDVESNKDEDDTDNNDEVTYKGTKDVAQRQEKMSTRQMKRRSQPNMMVAEDATKDDEEKKKRVQKRRSHANLVATGDLIDNIVGNLPKTYDLRHRIQPMLQPVHPVPSSSIMLSSDEEEMLSRQPVRRGRSPHRKIGIAPDPPEDNSEKQYTVVKSLAKYTVSVQEGNLLVRKEAAKEPTESATIKQDEDVKPVEPIISDVEEEEIVTPTQTVVAAPATTTSTTTSTTSSSPPAPRWMHLNSAEFLLALLLTALLFITYWCWNSDVC